ncbi:MAG: caspase family protein [Muribaculaceae bacterium]|nr:caspase family protein [Muribaculaceae bacterium]
MTLRKIIISLILPLASVFAADAQSLEQAERNLASWRTLSAASQPDGAAYSVLRQAYAAYAEAFRNSTPGSEQHTAAKTALKEIFPGLRRGAYFYAQANDQAMVLRFAADYIDLSLLPGMGDERLQESPGYPVLANLAATNIFNRGDYQSAILYFQAYLSSGDTQNRELAFEGLARSYYELRNYENAAYIATQGAAAYPSNWNMLVIGIESCGKTGADAKMEPMLQSALRIQPGHKGLLEYQGKMFERMKRYPEAADVFRQLYLGNQSSLDYTCHYAFDSYNAAIALKKADPQSARADSLLRDAIPLLKNILDNSPYAVNVAHALAVCYSLTGDKERLTEANSTLTALRVPAVTDKTLPNAETTYMPTANFDPLPEATASADTPLSDVDVDIPLAQVKRPDTYVVIIGNENYKYFSDVAFAKRDGATFAEYCRKTLGIPADNIRERYDATLSEIREPIRYLAEKTQMNPGELDIIFYYAGHGVPDVARGTAHLLPTDASGTDFESCYELDKLYAQFDEMPAKSVTVFLDACFSGATRGNEMLFAERFVEYEVEDAVAKGNTVVFSATTGKQTAMAYDEQSHGFFTYYLLKNLQQSAGVITLGELARKLTKEVDNKAYDKKNKHQTPTVNASAALGDSWRTRTL